MRRFIGPNARVSTVTVALLFMDGAAGVSVGDLPEPGGNTGQDDWSSLTYYDDGTTWTVMISISWYLLCWTDDA